MSGRPSARRGLGRGLGALIPTQPEPSATPGEVEISRAEDPATTSSAADPSRSASSGAGELAGPGVDTIGARQESDPTELQVVAGARFAELPVDSIRANHRQPREVFDEEAMAELVHSISEVGLLQPVVVRPSEDGETPYELIMGERRWRASKMAGLDLVPAIVRETDDADMLRDALLENLHRSQLNPLEEAAAYRQLLDDFACTQEQLASRIGRSRPQISNTLRLLRLSPAVQRRVGAGVLSAGHARALLSIDDAEIQDRLAQRVTAEGISVRALEEIVAVGEDGTQGRTRPRQARPVAPGLNDIADELSDRLETRVRVQLGRSRGKITIDFASMGDLKRILDLLRE